MNARRAVEEGNLYQTNNKNKTYATHKKVSKHEEIC